MADTSSSRSLFLFRRRLGSGVRSRLLLEPERALDSDRTGDADEPRCFSSRSLFFRRRRLGSGVPSRLLFESERALDSNASAGGGGGQRDIKAISLVH